jgi:hypothetical protein
VSDDDAAVRARLAALEAEVKAETDSRSAAKNAALARLREQKAKQDAERDALSARQAAAVQKAARPRRSSSDDLGDALELARKARGVKDELTRPRGEHEKSWLVSGGLSLLLGPLGWLYAGSFREAIPASAAYLLLATIVVKLPFMFVLMPAIFVAMVVSGLVGVFYSYQYNKHGSRQRLWGDKEKDGKQLATAKARLLDDD